jgi:chromosome segregation ATPase
LERTLVDNNRSQDAEFTDFLGAIDSNDINTNKKIAELELIMRSFSDQNEQLCQKIEKMESERCALMKQFNQLKYENAELHEKLADSQKYSDKEEIKKLQDECYDSKKKLADAIIHLEDVENKLYEKSEAHEKSLQVIQKACEHIEDLELHVEQLKSSQPNSLSSTESAKNEENNFSHANGIIMKLRKQIEQITNEKNEEIIQLKEELQKRARLSFQSINNANFNISQGIDFPTNEQSFNEIISKNRNVQKKIHFLKQKLR